MLHLFITLKCFNGFIRLISNIQLILYFHIILHSTLLRNNITDDIFCKINVSFYFALNMIMLVICGKLMKNQQFDVYYVGIGGEMGKLLSFCFTILNIIKLTSIPPRPLDAM